MFSYQICNRPDDNIFARQCAALEKRIPGLSKREILHDVDGSKFQGYEKNGQTITVKKDVAVGTIEIDSEFDIDPFFD